MNGLLHALNTHGWLATVLQPEAWAPDPGLAGAGCALVNTGEPAREARPGPGAAASGPCSPPGSDRRG